MPLCTPGSTSGGVADAQAPTVGRMVHYVSHGTPPRADGSQAYTSACRAAIVTDVLDVACEAGPCVSLCVLNPTGQFFNTHVCYHDGAETPAAPDCPMGSHADGPFRYCSCGWGEAGFRGGTWHWPQRIEGN